MTVYACDCGGCIYARDPNIKPLAYECEKCKKVYSVHPTPVLEFPVPSTLSHPSNG